MLVMKHLRENIRKNLRLVTVHVADCVAQDMTDVNRYAEDFYCGLLNTAFGYRLRNLNREKKNYAAIDLADEENGIAVQVTSTTNRAKVTKTLKKFFDGKMDTEFHRLVLLVIGKEDDFSKPFQVEREFDFDPARDIWDTSTLLGKLENIENIDTLKAVDEYLQKHLNIPTTAPRPIHLPVPERRSPVKFQGRKKELAWIESELKAGTKPVVVAGLGGVGKSELAAHFAKKHWRGQAYFVRFRDTFTRTLADSVGQAIPVQERKGMDEAQTAALALDYLRRCGPGDLLILDNAEVTGKTWAELTRDPNYAQLRRLPMAILVTTRHRDTGGLWLGSLERDELRQIFREHGVNIPEADMDALIGAVGEHTMTVDMIARTIWESWGAVTAKDILTAMEKSTLHDGDFEEIENDHDPEQRKIYAHLRALFDLSGISEDGRQALRCATLLPQGGMDAKLFRTALTEGAAKEIRMLEKRGWVDLKDGLVSIHPVVRLVCRTELVPTEENCGTFLEELADWYDPMQYAKDKYRQLAELFSIASNNLEDTNGDWANLAGFFWDGLGEMQKTLEYTLNSVEKSERSQSNTCELAAVYSNLGRAYYHLGNHKRALEFKEKALVICEQILPPEHIHIADCLSGLGAVYYAIGDYEKALEYQQKTLLIKEKTLPPEHLELATAYKNMGCACYGMGNYAEALEYQKQALVIFEKLLTHEHPYIASTYNDMAGVYAMQGDYERSLQYLMQALVIDEKVLPSEHPNLATTYSNLGGVHRALGEHEKALENKMKALSIREKILPPEHPDLAQSYNNVGYTYGKLGDQEKELEYYLKALAIREKALPPSHPDIARSCNNLGWTYYEMGQYERAAEYMRRAAEIAKRSLPEGHPNRVNFCRWAERLEQEARRHRGEE